MPFVTKKGALKQPEFGGVDLERLFAEATVRRVQVEKPRPRIIAVGGGKGGIGKTVVSALLGMTLAKLGHDTVLVDADFAGATLHGYLKTADSEKSLRSYLERKTDDINELAQPTPLPRLRLITGSPGIAAYQQLTYAAKQKLLRNMAHLRAGFVVLDLGAGSNYTNLDFFLLADDPILLTTCDSLSLQDAYGFVRVGLFRKLQKSGRAWPELFAQFVTLGDLQVKGDVATVDMFLQEYQPNYPAICSFIRRALSSFQPRLIINNLHPTDDRRKVQTLRLVVKNILGITLRYWGEIGADEFVQEAVRLANFEVLSSAPAAADVEKIVSTFILPSPPHISDNPGHLINGPFPRICTYQCVAWNDCKKRDGGKPCTRIP